MHFIYFFQVEIVAVLAILGLWSLEAPRLQGVAASFVLVREVNGKLDRNWRTPPSGRMVRRTLCFLQYLQI